MSFPPAMQLMPSQKIEAATQTNANLGALEPKTTNSIRNFFERGFKYFGAGTALSLIKCKTVVPFVLSGRDWCPALPKEIYSYSRSLCLSRDYIPGLKEVFDELAFKCPIHEELVFRFGMQYVLLNKLPKMLSNKFSCVADSMVAKIARVVVTAGAYSLAHAHPPDMEESNCSTATLVHTFATGLILGGVQEATESALSCMFMHSGLNVAAAFLSLNMTINLGCPPDVYS
jgi:hypothetical protein